jgi:septation ring formation regulator EzrA
MGEGADLSGIERAIGSLQGEVASLARTTETGFSEVKERLDRQNGRLRAAENESTKIRATMVSLRACQKIREACEIARGASRRLFWIPVAVGVVCSLVAVTVAKLF